MFTKETAYALIDEVAPDSEEFRFSRTAILEFVSEIEKRELFAKPRKPGSGRKSGLTKKKVIEILRSYLPEGEREPYPLPVVYSRNYLESIVEMGYLEKRNVSEGRRGRPRVEYVLTGKGRGYVALSKNWKLGD